MSKILVVEDNKDIRETTIEFLEMEGFTAAGFQNGQVALEYLQNEQNPLPKLIFIDLSMPIMSGTEFRENQMKIARLKLIPLVVMSADSKLDEKCRALDLMHCLRKPVDIDELLALATEFAGN